MGRKIEVRVVKLSPVAQLPTYAHTGDSGDLCADLASVDDYVIRRREIAKVHTGIALEFPPGYGALVHDRSGLAAKGLVTIGGVIDSGYRGEIIVLLINLGSADVKISRGDRIAQLRIVERITGKFVECRSLSRTERNERGFGSTGGTLAQLKHYRRETSVSDSLMHIFSVKPKGAKHWKLFGLDCYAEDEYPDVKRQRQLVKLIEQHHFQGAEVRYLTTAEGALLTKLQPDTIGRPAQKER